MDTGLRDGSYTPSKARAKFTNVQISRGIGGGFMKNRYVTAQKKFDDT